jgi:non-ribosomal peptide synthetase component F
VPSALTIAVRFTLRGPLDRAALADALTALADRHPALRTRYAVHDGVVLQQVLRPRPVPLPVRTAPADRWDAIAADWAAQPFALDAEPGFRAALLAEEQDGDPAELLLAIHHGVCDGWSLGVMTEDLTELYRAAVTGEPAALPALDVDFIDYATWERGYLESAETRAALQSWVHRVGPGLRPLVLPADRPRTANLSRAGAVHYTLLPADLMRRVTAYAAERVSTPYAVLAAAFAWLAHRLTGADTIPLNSTVANRPDPRFDRVVGIFANAAWLVVPAGAATSFDDLVTRATEANWQMLAMQSVPSRTQTRALGEAFTAPERVYFAMLDEGDAELRLPGLAPAPARPIEMSGGRGDQAWELRVLPDGAVELQIGYVLALFDEPTVARWAERYVELLTQALNDPSAPLPDLDAPGSGPGHVV